MVSTLNYFNSMSITLYKEVLMVEAANQLGSLNGKIAKVRSQLNAIADNRLNVIKKFTADQITSEEKAELVASYDEEKLVSYHRECNLFLYLR